MRYFFSPCVSHSEFSESRACLSLAKHLGQDNSRLSRLCMSVSRQLINPTVGQSDWSANAI